MSTQIKIMIGAFVVAMVANILIIIFFPDFFSHVLWFRSFGLFGSSPR